MRWPLAAITMMALGIAALAEPQTTRAGGCLRWHDIDTLTRAGPDTVLVKTRTKGAYVIKFTGPCDFQRSSRNYFIVRLHDRWECVKSLGALDVHESGACFIESITPTNETNETSIK